MPQPHMNQNRNGLRAAAAWLVEDVGEAGSWGWAAVGFGGGFDTARLTWCSW